jgi:hypothetical protein
MLLRFLQRLQRWTEMARHQHVKAGKASAKARAKKAPVKKKKAATKKKR